MKKQLLSFLLFSVGLPGVAWAANIYIGTYTVDYYSNCAGLYTDQSNPDYSKANPYYGNYIAPGPIFINAAPGEYEITVDAQNGLNGCSVWSGDATSGSCYWTSSPSMEFNHQSGQIALYVWDWYPWDNSPDWTVTLSVYEVPEPCIVSLFGLCCFGAVALRRRMTS